MLGQRLRRWPNFEPAMIQLSIIVGISRTLIKVYEGWVNSPTQPPELAT